MLKFSSCNPQFFAVRQSFTILIPVNPSSGYFHTGVVVPSSDHCRSDTVLPSSDHYCIETVAPSGGRYCIGIVVPSSDQCCTEAERNYESRLENKHSPNVWEHDPPLATPL